MDAENCKAQQLLAQCRKKPNAPVSSEVTQPPGFATNVEAVAVSGSRDYGRKARVVIPVVVGVAIIGAFAGGPLGALLGLAVGSVLAIVVAEMLI